VLIVTFKLVEMASFVIAKLSEFHLCNVQDDTLDKSPIEIIPNI